MTPLFAWSLQISALIAAGVLLAPLVKVPRARLWFWQALIMLTLSLPVLEPWKIPPPVLLPAGTFFAIMPLTASLMDSAPIPFWARINWVEILVAGACLRFVWLAIGLWRLRQLRLNAERIDPPISTYNSRLEWYVSDGVAGPVTFGWAKPSILLPIHVCAMPREMQRAIAWHELLHVERRDWLFVMAEELVRGVLWFHPAVWYALSQVQLAREQTVDDAVVSTTRDRSGYLEALVAAAAHKMGAGLTPAPLFLKKRQLAARVAAILKEAPMSKLKLITRAVLASGAILAVVLMLAVFVPFQAEAQVIQHPTNVAFQLRQPPPPPAPSTLVIPEGTMHVASQIVKQSLLKQVNPVYPPEAKAARIQGQVVLEVLLGTNGLVEAIGLLSGPPLLTQAAIDAVSQWEYKPFLLNGQPTRVVTNVEINFALN